MNEIAKKWMVAGLSLVIVQFARAGDVFKMDFGSPTNAISGSNLQDVFARTVDYFEANFFTTGTLNYGGCKNAIQLSFQSFDPVSLTNATLIIPATGFTRSFRATNAASLERQLRKFLSSEGANELRALQEKIAANSLIASTDGTPHSSTALLANRAYDQFGTDEGRSREERAKPPKADRGVRLSLAPDVGRISAGGFKGSTYTLPIDASFKLHERTGLHLDLTPNYIEIEGSDIYQIAMGLGMPAKILTGGQDSPWLWRVAPSAGAVASASEDLNAGGWIIQGSLTSLASYDTPRFTLSMGNHFSFYESRTLSEGGYTFDPGVSQQIFKNGLSLSVPLGQRWVTRFYGIHTHFVQNAAVDDYYTVGASVTYRYAGKYKNILTRRGYFFVGIYTDFADHYSSPHMRMGNTWSF